MILNLAIDLVRSDLIHKGLPSTLPGTAPKGGGDVEATIRYLDDFAGQFEFQTVVEDDFFPFATTVIEDKEKVSRSLLETLYYKGITEKFYDDRTNDDVGTVNILKLARDLMEKRVIIARDMISILSVLIENDVGLFKMIQDRGGFKRFDMESKPNFKIIDLEVERLEKMQKMDKEIQEEKKRKEKEKKDEFEKQNRNEDELNDMTNNFEGNEGHDYSGGEEDMDMDRNVEGFGVDGPTLM